MDKSSLSNQPVKPNAVLYWRDKSLQILRAYGAILFIKSTAWGSVIALATFFSPNVGIAGLLGAIMAMLITDRLRFVSDKDGIYIVNCLLGGLAIGAFYKLTAPALLLLIIMCFFTIFISAILNHLLWKHFRLGTLSIPFVMATFLIFFASRNFDLLVYNLPPSSNAPSWLYFEINQFFETLGALFFLPNSYLGMVVFTAILFYSRYLAFLAVAGYIFGAILLYSLMDSVSQNMLAWSGFNFALAAMAVGGIFTVPSRGGFVLAMVSSLLAAVITASMSTLLFNFNLPVLATPFLLSTLTIIAALKLRTAYLPPYVADPPASPEQNYERARLTRYRNGEFNSVPIMVPFLGQWMVYQGFDGPHTHKGAWRYAFDFYITENRQSFQDGGYQLDDYFCFGLPVISPVYGMVIRCFDALADNKPGEMDTTNNWGNFILIQLDSGLCVMLAHLKQSSIKVKEKQRIAPGDIIAACGNSGRSPQPHLHIQIQESAELNAATRPFHFASVIETNNDRRAYALVSVPKAGEIIEMASSSPALQKMLHLPVGRQLQYQWQGDDKSERVTRTLTVKVNLEGEYRLHSDVGASVAFSEANGVLAFYDRMGTKDEFLDAWLLCMGLTPLSEQVNQWQDSPSHHLYPANLLQALQAVLQYPLGCGLKSFYQRHWDEDGKAWIQESNHALPITGSPTVAATALINPNLGCFEFRIEIGQRIARAKLDTIGLVADEGIPGWAEAVSHDQ